MLNKNPKGEEESKLNFYSKYNRVKDKQDISTLYSLLDDAQANRRRFESLTFTLNVSRNDSDNNSPIRLFSGKQKGLHDLSEKRILTLYERDDSLQGREMGEKTDKLQRLEDLERQFHEQISGTERQGKGRRKVQRDNRQKQKEFITMEDALSDNQENGQLQLEGDNKEEGLGQGESREHEQSVLKEERYLGEQKEQKVLVDDAKGGQSNANHKLRGINEKYVESVDGDLEGHSSSIVIERMQAHFKRQKAGPQQTDTQQNGVKPAQNYCQTELSHSQSEYVIPQYRQANGSVQGHTNKAQIESEVEDKQVVAQAEVVVDESRRYEGNEEMGYSPIMLLPENSLVAQINEERGVKELIGEGGQQMEQRDGEITPKFDVKSDDQIRPNAFHSQVPKWRTLRQQKQVESIQQQAPQLHSSQSFLPLQEQNMAGSSAFPAKQPLKLTKKQSNHTEKKTSFKKLMASNRGNLVPRLAISTILNEHINQVLGDYRSSNLNRTAKLQSDSHLPSKSPFPSSSKVNFKKVLQMSRLCRSGSREGKLPTDKHAAGRGKRNLQLLMGFFSQN